ncbi:CDP-diacylglycerol--serine O-phosphatidyltransferase [Alphaproteobacteria bacterium]|nr:CDP-diacylglycerol--serine O-phosphatidyltransferase [Alphaproteobacteria bacterium]
MDKQSYYLSKYIPNFITILSLCCGLSSVRFSISENWKIAVYLIILAAIFDFFDGWFARKLKEGTYFGAELDSLSDFISFGVAPSLLIFYWSLSELKSLGWSITLFFVICAALRLARFTADIYLTTKPIDSNMYFVGVPSPAAAGLSLLPLFIFFEFDFTLIQNEYLNSCNLSIIGLLMVSKIPTISLKNINFSKNTRPWIILLIAVICIGLISNLWLTLIFITSAYIISIFYTVFVNLRTKN